MSPNAINDKKNEIKKNKNGDITKDNWTGFAIMCFVNFVVVIILGITVSNFIYLTKLSKNSLDILFPSNEKDYFNSSYSQQGGSGIEIGDLGEDLKNLGVPPLPGWPYTMVDGDNTGLSVRGFKNWLAFSSADTYILLRHYLKSLISKLHRINKLHNFDRFILSCIAIGFSFVGLAATPLPAYGFSFLRTWNQGGIISTLVAFFTFAFSSFALGISMAVSLQYLFTILLLPILLNSNSVKNIAFENSVPIAILFRFLCSLSGFAYLKDNVTIPTVMMIYTVICFALYRNKGIII